MSKAKRSFDYMRDQDLLLFLIRDGLRVGDAGVNMLAMECCRRVGAPLFELLVRELSRDDFRRDHRLRLYEALSSLGSTRDMSSFQKLCGIVAGEKNTEVRAAGERLVATMLERQPYLDCTGYADQLEELATTAIQGLMAPLSRGRKPAQTIRADARRPVGPGTAESPNRGSRGRFTDAS